MNTSETRLFRELCDERREMAEVLKAVLIEEGGGTEKRTTSCTCALCKSYKYLQKKGFYR